MNTKTKKAPLKAKKTKAPTRNSPVVLTAHKITFEVEMTPRPSTLPPATYPDPKEFEVPYTVRTSLRVDGALCAFVSKLDIQADVMNAWPLLKVDLGEGAVVVDSKRYPPETRKRLAEVANVLRQFPFVRVHVPLVATDTKPVV